MIWESRKYPKQIHNYYTVFAHLAIETTVKADNHGYFCWLIVMTFDGYHQERIRTGD